MGWSPFRPIGLTYKDYRSAGGFTLITPLGGDTVYLLDEQGRIVHFWQVDQFMPGYGYLLPGGNLLVRGQERAKNEVDPGRPAGKADILIELDWDSKTIWQWEHPNFHHDMHRLPNGNTLALTWVPLPEEIGARIKGGITGEMAQFYASDPHFPPFLLAGVGVGGRPRIKGPLGDAIVEIDPRGKVIREWLAHEHLNPEKDILDPQDFREEWSHANALTCTPEGGVIISFRELSTIMILDWPSGEVRWKWGRPYLSCQHSPNITPDGTLLVFDNGAHHPIQSKSRVVEVDIAQKKIIWQYFGSPIFSLFSGHIAGAERLPNGNTFICEGESGRLFEITREGDYVWEWNSPFVHDFKGVKNVQIFRAHRYPSDGPELAGRHLDATRYEDLNKKWGLIKK
jgi:hypothetical protein